MNAIICNDKLDKKIRLTGQYAFRIFRPSRVQPARSIATLLPAPPSPTIQVKPAAMYHCFMDGPNIVNAGMPRHFLSQITAAGAIHGAWNL
jgi:hypothetical protein